MEEFENILESRILKTRAVLIEKKTEYAKGCNRYHNFDEAARLIGSTPERALMGMLHKHYVSINDIANSSHHAIIEPALIDEKIGDAINYLILLEGLFVRRFDKNKTGYHG